MDNIDKIKKLSIKGHEAKEIARKNVLNIKHYNISAKYYHNAVKLSDEEILNSDLKKDHRCQLEIYSNYYSFEENNCRSAFFYEKRDKIKSILYHNKSMDYLEKAILLIDKYLSNVNESAKEQLAINKKLWIYYQISNKARYYSIQARFHFDNHEFVEALDNYKEGALLQKNAIEYSENNNLDPVFIRISKGNYISLQANISNSLTGVLFDHYSSASDPKINSIPETFIPHLLGYTLDSYIYSLKAYAENPEWKQYLDGSEVCLRNINKILQQNYNMWESFYHEFEAKKELIVIMKKMDVKHYNEIERKCIYDDNKIVKVWSYGSFFILLFLIIIFTLAFLTKIINEWYILIAVISSGEIVLLIVSSFILRLTGDLTESNFIKILSLAIRFQFKIFSKKIDKNN